MTLDDAKRELISLAPQMRVALKVEWTYFNNQQKVIYIAEITTTQNQPFVKVQGATINEVMNHARQTVHEKKMPRP